MVITGVAARMPERIHRLVYLDAAVPDPGESLYDLLTSGLVGGSGNRPHLPEPSPPYVEKLHYDPEKIRLLPKTYILCTESEFAPVTRMMKQRIDRSRNGWTYCELPTSHVPMASMPDRFYQMLLDSAEK
jgi:pimeloyl-ACP methyl ester carboxylesterase